MQDLSKRSIKPFPFNCCTEPDLCLIGKQILPSYFFIVTVAVIVQVPLTEQSWHHLQGSLKSLTHLMPLCIQGLCGAFMPENVSFILRCYQILMVTFLTHRPTSSTRGRGSRGMTTTNKGNKALKVNSLHETELRLYNFI